MLSVAVLLSRMILLPLYSTDVLLCLEAWDHHLMAAAQAAQAEIRTSAQNLPAIRAAWVGLFHNENIL